MFKRLKAVAFVGAVLIGVAATNRIVSSQSSSRAGFAAAGTTALETMRVDRGDVAITINATGNIQAVQSVSLAFASSGVVTAINVREGDTVRKGQTLALLDDQTARDAIVSAQLRVDSQQLALKKLNEKPRQVDIDVAQASVKAAQAQVAEAGIGSTDAAQLQIAQLQVQIAQNSVWQAELSRDANNLRAANARGAAASSLPSANQTVKSLNDANAQLANAQAQLRVVQSQGASVSSIDSAKASLVSAQANLQTLLNGPNANDIKAAEANGSSAQAALTQAQADLDKTRLIAPFDGLVAKLAMSIGQQAPSSAAAVMLDVSSFYVNLPVAEIDIARIQAAMPVNLRFDALPNTTLQGKVTQIAEAPNTGSPVTYNVRVSIDPAGKPLLSTMSTTASIGTSNAANVIRLPNRFIRLDTNTKKAYATVRQPDNTFKEVEIQLGAASDSYTEITAGVNAGDMVAVPQANGGGGFGNRGPGGLPIRAITGG